MNRKDIADIIIGLLIGAVLMLAIQGRELNRLYFELATLKIQYDEAWHENQQLASLLRQPRTAPALRSIRVDADAEDPISEIAAIQFVKQQLAYLVGVKLKELDPTTLYYLLEGRTFRIEQQYAKLHVRTIVIGETSYIRVSVVLIQAS